MWRCVSVDLWEYNIFLHFFWMFSYIDCIFVISKTDNRWCQLETVQTVEGHEENQHGQCRCHYRTVSHLAHGRNSGFWYFRICHHPLCTTWQLRRKLQGKEVKLENICQSGKSKKMIAIAWIVRMYILFMVLYLKKTVLNLRELITEILIDFLTIIICFSRKIAEGI